MAIPVVLSAGAAQACDMHGEDFSPMTAYIDYRGMTEEQMREADLKAWEKAHEAAQARAMAAARFALATRFNIKVDPAPEPQVAEASDRRASSVQ